MTRAAVSTVPSQPSDEFQRAFVAASYLLGLRTELATPLAAVCASARALARRLDDPDRAQRARVLAPELARIVRALDVRRIA